MSPRSIGVGQFPPDYPRSICAVLPTALHAIGVPLPRGYALLDLPHLRRRKFRRLFFYFLDSLGLDACRKSGGLFSRLLKTHGLPLTSVFPSITSTALCSIYTGLPPARHGVMGHKIFFDEIQSVVDVLKMEIPGFHRPLKSVGLSVKHWLRVPPLLGPLFLRRRKAVHISPHPILHSGISDMIYEQLRREGYEEYIEGINKAEYFLKNGYDIVNFYQHGIDESTHRFGDGSEQVFFSLRNIEGGVQWLADHLPPAVLRTTLFVLVSDHGQNTFQPGRILHFPYDEIQRQKQALGLVAVGTSGRFAHVYSARYPNPALQLWLEKKCKGKASVVPRHTSWQLAGGAGPVPPYARRLGEYTLLLHPGVRLRVEFTPPKEEKVLHFSSANHGSLTASELNVPALFVPMDEIR